MNAIRLKGVKVHNLKNIDVTIPHAQFIVISGISGSGKSSLALDTLYAEGQRRFIESLSAYARQFLERMERPAIDYVTGMLPAIAIESKNSITNARSTVGTQTEINDYLRILFARIGKTYCHSCHTIVQKDTPHDVVHTIMQLPRKTPFLVTFHIHIGKESKKYLKEYLHELVKQGFSRMYVNNTVLNITDTHIKEKLYAKQSIEIVVDRLALKEYIEKRLIDSLETAYHHGKGHLSIILLDAQKPKRLPFSQVFHCSTCDILYQEPHPNIFSFNSPLGACPTCQGFGRIITIDRHLVVPDEKKSVAEGAVMPWSTKSTTGEYEQLKAFCRRKRISIKKPFQALTGEEQNLIFEGDKTFFGINGFFKYLEKKSYKMHVRVFLSRYRTYILCPGCRGSRLKAHAHYVKVNGKNIYELTCMTINCLCDFFEKLTVTPYEEKIAAVVLGEIRNRLRFLKDVGLGYLTLERLSRTLSGGECQRINLASALGSNLVDTLYVLDEPSVGLHPRDNGMVIHILKRLKKLGNTVVVIEHDKDMITKADMVIDLGPFAGERGGAILYQGDIPGLKRCKSSLTGKYLRNEEKITFNKSYLSVSAKTKIEQRKKSLTIIEAYEHNLKKINISIPLGKLVVITGVSGSGKSTLVYDVLYNNFLRFRGRSVGAVGAVKNIKGFEHVADVVLVDQTPIGRTPRSNPVTFIGVFSAIRDLFAKARGARLRKMKTRHFSFNVDGGRCAACKGDGKIKVEMHFLADMYITCEACGGTRYRRDVLDVMLDGKNIHDVLQLTVDDALAFFKDSRSIIKRLQILHDVGLGYLKLGQPAPTLSAGEAQRLKLAVELLAAERNNILFLFDEPTVGLHYHDISYLMHALEKLLERGNSIIMIEHNLEVIKCADHIIDLGPEGGDEGGEVIFTGTPQELVRMRRSYTGQFLKEYV